jgi:SulP family sulfate permease
MAKDTLTADVWGGLAAMLVALPSAIAFGVAIYAPLGPESAALGAMAGMVGAVLLGVINPLLGGTQRLISAPCAPAAAVMGALAAELVKDREPTAALLMMTAVALLSGLLQVGYGVVGGGRVIKYIPYPAVSGFLSGVAVLIFVKQLPGLLGVSSGKGLLATLGAPEAFRMPSVVVGLVTIAGVFLAPKLIRGVPAPIVGLAAGVAAYFALSLQNPALRTIADNPLVVGRVEVSLGSLSSGMQQRGSALAGFQLADVASLLVPALTLSALLSIDTLKTGVIVDAMTRSRSDSNKELRAQGVGNVVTALFGGVPGAGTMGATLVNVTSGGKTRLSGVLEGVFCLVAFVALRSVVAWIPIAALSGILIVIAIRMLDTKSFRLLKNRSTLPDFAVIATVVLVAVSVGLIQASAVGFGLAILLFAREHMSASVMRRRVSGHQLSSKQRRMPQEVELLEAHGSQTTVCELQGNLFFGTTDQLFSELAEDLKEKRFIVLDMRRVHSVDFTAARLLDQMDVQLEEHGGHLVLSGIPAALPTGRDIRAYLADLQIGKDSGGIEMFDDLDAALEWVEDQILEKTMPERRASASALDLAGLDLFDDLERHGLLDEVSDCVEARSFQAGDTIFDKGDTGDELFVIRRGSVRILLPLEAGRTLHVASFGRNNFFGEMAFLDRGTRSARAIALTDTELFVLSRARFDELSRKKPVVGVKVFARLARALALRLRRTDAEVTALQV